MSVDPANLTYLILLLIFIGSFAFLRGNLSKNINYLLIWAGIIVALIFGYQIYEKMTSRPVQNADGSYDLRIPYDEYYQGYVVYFDANDATVQAIIDTGASQIVMTYDDAQNSGLEPENLRFDSEVSTANGVTHVATAKLDKLAFGDVLFENVDVLVAQDDDLEITLLGMNLLRQFESFNANGEVLLINF